MYTILPLTAASGTVGHSPAKINFPSNMQHGAELFKYTYLKHYKIRGIFHHVLDSLLSSLVTLRGCISSCQVFKLSLTMIILKGYENISLPFCFQL